MSRPKTYYVEKKLDGDYINGYKIPNSIYLLLDPPKSHEEILQLAIKESQYIEFEEVKK